MSSEQSLLNHNIDVLLHIFSHLDAQSIVQLTNSCRAFHSVYHNHEYFRRCAPVSITFFFKSYEIAVKVDESTFLFQYCSKNNITIVAEKEKCLFGGYHVHEQAKKKHSNISTDPIRACLTFVNSLLASSVLSFETVKIVEHPWFVTHDIDEENMQHRSEEDYAEWGHTHSLLTSISNKVRRCEVIDLTTHSWNLEGEVIELSKAYWRTVHRRLIGSFGLNRDQFEDLLEAEMSRPERSLAVSEEGLQFMSLPERRSYRQLEAKRILPKVLVDIFQKKENGLHKFYVA